MPMSKNKEAARGLDVSLWLILDDSVDDATYSAVGRTTHLAVNRTVNGTVCRAVRRAVRRDDRL